MNRKITLISSLTFSMALFVIPACATDEGRPDQGDHDQVGSGATCGGCDPSQETVNDDGTVDVCAPCDGSDVPGPQDIPTDPIIAPGGGAGSAVTARLGPLGLVDKQQCKQDWELALAACDRDLACDAAYQPGLDACIQAVYQRCGTSSPYHTCVITGRQQCVSDAAATLQGCNRDVDAAHQRCRAGATIDYYDCMTPPGRSEGFYKLLRRHKVL